MVVYVITMVNFGDRNYELSIGKYNPFQWTFVNNVVCYLTYIFNFVEFTSRCYGSKTKKEQILLQKIVH